MEGKIARAWQIRKANFADQIEFDIPVKTKAISVTGNHCELKCAHCNGHYLGQMADIKDWRAEIGPDTTSYLISGGCDKNGKVPILRHLPLLQKMKQSQRRTNLHVGLLDKDEIEQISKVADVVSFDFVGDDVTIKEVYGLDKKVVDYINVYQALQKKIKVIPHICIGLRGGQISGEYKALELLRELGPEGLVFIVLAPTEGTLWANKTPPAIDDVVQVLCQAREMFPKVPIHLGCMRPRGSYRSRLDYLAVRCGVNKIVQPTPDAIALAQELGLIIKRGEECCVL